VAPAAANLDRALSRFFETAGQYEQTFRNLTVEETKVIEEFDQSGRVKKRREIVADLHVYRPARGADEIATEYRDVRLVDGKAVEQRGKRALDFNWVGPAQLSGHDVVELEYREVVPRAQYGIERPYKGASSSSGTRM
jgi:hypothetical protein